MARRCLRSTCRVAASTAPLLVLASTLVASDGGAAESSRWRQMSLWDDGKAEFCAYELEWRRYGRLNRGRALLILVKEPWAPDLGVKADRPRPDGFDVLKLNHLRDVPTGVYTYHQMASVFVRRDSGTLVKLVATSSEGCGISTARATRGRLATHSYFDGQGDRETSYPEGVLSEDGLPMTLRDFVSGEPPDELEVFPSLMAGRFTRLAPSTYSIERRRRSGLEVPAGTFDVVEMRLESGEDRITFAFAAEAPHPLIELRRNDGTNYRLAKCERISYWQMNGPGGENWLPERVREVIGGSGSPALR